MYSPEQLFIMRMDDLKAILEHPSERNLFAAAGYLRQLLLTEPLVHQANHRIKHKFRFAINPFDNPTKGLSLPDPVFFANIDGFSPSLSPPYNVTQVGLDDLLAATVAEIRTQPISVKDVITYVAYHAGAVHNSAARTLQTQALDELSKGLRIADMPFALPLLRSICDVVVTGCEPLYQALRA